LTLHALIEETAEWVGANDANADRPIIHLDGPLYEASELGEKYGFDLIFRCRLRPYPGGGHDGTHGQCANHDQSASEQGTPILQAFSLP
jgi:hypothetical protein